MNSQFNQQHRNARSLRRAFTLVEMLVAMTLVLLMMTLFGEIFSLATGSMNLQRAIAENDQQIRTLTTVLRGDLQKRTFRNAVPFFPLESHEDPTTSFNEREGYFYISLNSSNNAVDNVLQFTVRSTILKESIDDRLYYGSANTLGPSTATAFLANRNQPEHDDGVISPNGAGASSAAEVSYFVRNGSLYRRQLLLRNGGQPTRGSDNADYFAWNTSASPPAPFLYTGDFWDDFDYAAYSRFEGTQRTGAGFVSDKDLTNEFTVGLGTYDGTFRIPLDLNQASVSLGRTRLRFGFDPFTGLSREFGSSTGAFFIGRFTQEETSASNFNYPHMACEISGGGSVLGNGNVMNATGTELTDLVDESGFGLPDGRVDEFQRNASTGVPGGPRIGEDLLLTNVHEFRIDVWDQRINKYVPVGHSDPTVDGLGAVGDFHSSRQLNGAFAPVGGSANAFDTWHPAYDRDNFDGDWDDTTGADNPPFRPMTWDPLGISAPVPFNSGPNSFWDQSTAYAVNDVVFPPTEDANLDGFWDVATEDANSNGQYDRSGPVDVHGRVYFYRCVQAGSGSPTTWEQPTWGSTPGQMIQTTDGYVWQVQSNLRPLKSIQVTVRFLHRRSGKMRQLTLIQPLTK